MQNKIKTKLKQVLDILMLLAFVFTLASLGFNDKIVHEISGLMTIPLIVTHLALNFNWIKGITKNLFRIKLKKKILFQYVLFILLTAFFITVIITGFLTSSFVSHSGIGNVAHRRHTIPSIVFMVLIATHILLHLRYIKSSFLKKKKAEKETKNNEKENQILNN